MNAADRPTETDTEPTQCKRCHDTAPVDRRCLCAACARHADDCREGLRAYLTAARDDAATIAARAA